MARDFAIDGTGQVIRPGDEVFYRGALMGDSDGSGHVTEIISEDFVRVSSAGEVFVGKIVRADDNERDLSGSPLWVD